MQTRFRERQVLQALRGPAVFAVLTAWTGLAVLPAPASAETLIVQGSTTFNRSFMEPQQAALETATGHVLTVIPNKSMPGLIALMEGRAHMAMISASLESEVHMLERVMPGLPFDQLQVHHILSARVAIAVHPSNPVRTAKIGDIKQVLLGRITNWAALGGPSKAVRIVLVGGGGGVTTAVEAEFLDGKQANLPNVTYMKNPSAARAGG